MISIIYNYDALRTEFISNRKYLTINDESIEKLDKFSLMNLLYNHFGASELYESLNSYSFCMFLDTKTTNNATLAKFMHSIFGE